MLRPLHIDHYHVDPKHPHHKPELADLMRQAIVYVDDREIREAFHVDRVNGFVRAYAHDASGNCILDKGPRGKHLRRARHKGTVTVFIKDTGTDATRVQPA